MFPQPSPPETPNQILIREFRERNHQAIGLGFKAGFPTFFFSGFQDSIGETVLIKQFFILALNITSADLAIEAANFGDGNINDFRERFKAVNFFATRNPNLEVPFVGGFPTFEPPDINNSGENGAILFPVGIAEFRNVSLSDLRDLISGVSLDDPREEFKAIRNFAFNQGFPAGFPTFIRGNSADSDGSLDTEPTGGLTRVILLKDVAADRKDLQVFTPIP